MLVIIILAFKEAKETLNFILFKGLKEVDTLFLLVVENSKIWQWKDFSGRQAS